MDLLLQCPTTDREASCLPAKTSPVLDGADLGGQEVVEARCKLSQMLAVTGWAEILRIVQATGLPQVSLELRSELVLIKTKIKAPSCIGRPQGTRTFFVCQLWSQTDAVFVFKPKAPALFLTRLPTQKNSPLWKARKTPAYSTSSKRSSRPRRQRNSPSLATLKSLELCPGQAPTPRCLVPLRWIITK